VGSERYRRAEVPLIPLEVGSERYRSAEVPLIPLEVGVRAISTFEFARSGLDAGMGGLRGSTSDVGHIEITSGMKRNEEPLFTGKS
jgi:hypothetical protein